jgi:S-formylglutathione hydrolase FrmB
MQNGFGLTVVGQQALDARLSVVTLTTAALPGPTHVYILLPSGYSSAKRYPVLYLLHGTWGSAADWTTSGNAEAVTAGQPLIVVMPDIALNSDGGGWCSDWQSGLYKWETYHIRQLLPWIDANLNTIPVRSERAIAGLPQGGLCVMSYAARHPDLFASAFSFSGLLDIAGDPGSKAETTLAVDATEILFDRVRARSIFGRRITDELNWAAHDPTSLAGNLQQTRLYQFFGNGVPGSLDVVQNPSEAMQTIAGAAIEGALFPTNVLFHNRLATLGIPSYYDYYGNGTHNWPYWTRDLAESLPLLMEDFGNPAPPPSSIRYMSADDSYSVYGWDVAMTRLAREFTTLSGASCSGFTLSGSGTGTVATPACFLPGVSYAVAMAGSQSGSSQTSVAAGSDGRLTLSVPLGPPNPYQEFTGQSNRAGTAVYSTTVTITPQT